MTGKSAALIPSHLKQYIVDQHYENYTWRDHAVWRYVMRRNISYLSQCAHKSYLDGLTKTGISIEKIPSLEEMNRILEGIGWAAVCVSGFIPPEAFMEFQAHRILVIAADIRHLEHIEYTPAPDILHEAAGHAPIITNPVYSDYLQEFGRVGKTAFSSAKDHQVYEAIKALSDLKALPDSDVEQLLALENKIVELEESVGNPSEMSLLRNLHWWTVEYGLIGELKKPQIYGAGLLSSIGESVESMASTVKKIPYSIEAMHYGFDITKMQPQLFVSPDFDFLTVVLKQFSDQMAIVKGGTEGVLKAIESKHMATCQLSSGIQIAGVFTDCILEGADLVYFKTVGATALGYNNELLAGHGEEYHADGFGSPIGKLKNCNKPIRFLEKEDLNRLSIKIGKLAKLEFLSGLKVEGILTNFVRRDGRILLMSFKNCTVQYKTEILFMPDWGTFDMAVGEQVTSAFSGSFYSASLQNKDFNLSTERQGNPIAEQLDLWYKQVREWRDKKERLPNISPMIQEIKQLDAKDWLLPFELLEIARENQDLLNEKVAIDYLKSMPKTYHHLSR